MKKSLNETNNLVFWNQFKSGDEYSFKQIYEKYFPLMKYYGQNYIKDEQTIHDLIQEVFIKLWAKRKQFENENMIKNFLYKVMKNTCLTFIRNQKVKEKHAEFLKEEDIEESFLNKVIEIEVYSILGDVFDELPPTCKKVYKLSLEGLGHSEIAEELNITINTVKKHKNRANHYLKSRLENLLSLLLTIMS